MVFLVGPRQCGKTYLAKEIAKDFDNSLYLNWDETEDQPVIQNKDWLDDTDLLILDELHKMPNWKNYLKGLFDTKASTLKILVTGSARLDIFNHIGDSLAGRFFCHHLFPLSASELHQIGRKVELSKLINRGGFPEPFLAESNTEAERWRTQYTNSMINIDVFTVDNIKNLNSIRQTFELLRKRVGSPVSYQSIARDIGIAPKTVKKYIDVLEALYIVFRITPYSKNIARSILKEPKIYFFDTALVNGDKGAKFENLVAISLLKHVYAKQDYKGEPYKLHYMRNKDKREVDFALSNGKNIEQLIEAKVSESALDPNLLFFSETYQLNAVQIVYSLSRARKAKGIPIVSALKFLEQLDL